MFFLGLGEAMWQLLIHPSVPYIFCGIIIAVFIYVCFFYKRNNKKLIAESIAKVYDALSGINDRKSFYENYESIDSKLSENKVFQESWGEFDETILLDADKQLIVTTKRPHDYFNEHTIISPYIDLRLLHAVPNYLIGLGLLFTFIGLVAAIHFAAGGLGSADGGQQALRNLLQMASVKFWSSIAGLFCSILLSISLKRWLNDLNKKLHEICRKLEKFTLSKTVEQLLSESLKDQKEQTNTLQHLAAEIAIQINNALADKLPASVAAAMQPLAEALNNTAQKLTSANSDSLEQLLSDFTKKLEGATHNEMQDLVSGLKDIQVSLQGLLQHIQQTGEAFGSKIVDAAGQLGTALESTMSDFSNKLQGAAQSEIQDLVVGLKSTQESLQGLVGHIQNTGDAFGSKITGAAGELSNTLLPVSENLLNFNSNIGLINEKMYAQLDRFDSNIASLNVTLQNIKQTAEHVYEAGQPLSNAAEGIKVTARSMEAAYKQIQDTHNNSQQATSAIQRVSEKVVTVWDSYENRFKAVDQDMVKAFTSIQGGLDAFKKHVGEFVSQFDEKFRSAISLLEGAISDLAEERAENDTSSPKN